MSNDVIVKKQHNVMRDGCTDGDKAKKSSLKKTREGTVVSNCMDKTVVVASIVPVKHKKYGKFVRITKKFYAHDEHNQCLVGDKVKIVETRPLSKTKRWRVVEVKVTAGDSSLGEI